MVHIWWPGRKAITVEVVALLSGQEDSCPDYMLKAERRLELEEERVDHYLHVSTKDKLLKEVQTELLAKYETELLEKEHSGCAALLRDDKVLRMGLEVERGWKGTKERALPSLVHAGFPPAESQRS